MDTEKRICTDCGHSHNGFLMICLVRKRQKTFYSTGKTETLYQTCDSANYNGECGKFVHRVNIMPAMIRWWRNWWDKYYEKKEEGKSLYERRTHLRHK